MAQYKFGELALQSFLGQKKQQAEEAQFNKQLAQTERQNSLLNQIRQAQLAVTKDKFAETQEQNEFYRELAGDKLAFSKEKETYDREQDKIKNEFERTRLGIMATNAKKNKGYINSYNTGYTQRNPETGKPEFIPFKNATTGKSDFTPYQKYNIERNEKIDEAKRQKRINENFLTAGALFGAKRGGIKRIEDKQGNERKVYQQGETVIDPKIWELKTKSTVNQLLSDLGLKQTKKDLIEGVKNKLKETTDLTKGRKLTVSKWNGLTSAQKRAVLEQALLHNKKSFSENQLKALKYSFDLDYE